MSKPQLREHQTTGISRTREEWNKGNTRTAIVHATGLGKGHMIGAMVADRELMGKSLVLAHREEILDELTMRTRLFDPRARIGRVQGAANGIHSDVVMAMTQTARGDARLAALVKAGFDSVALDECHTAANPGNMKILSALGVFSGRTRLVGFTATFMRGDQETKGKPKLGDVFQSLADERNIGWGISNGFLVRPYGKAVVTSNMNLDQARHSTTVDGSDFNATDTGEMVEQDAPEIVAAWLANARLDTGSDTATVRYRKTIAFVPSVASADRLAAEFIGAGISTEVVTGKTSSADRRKIYARLASGETTILVNVFVLVEGFNEPSIECVLWARPTELPGVYIQGIGRGLRLHTFADGRIKYDCLVLDVVGASRRNSLFCLPDLEPSVPYDSDDLDALPCTRCGEPKAECECAPGEGLAGPGRKRLEGPAEYEDIDLVESSSISFNWQRSWAGKQFLNCGKRALVLWQHPETGLFKVGHVSIDGTWPLGEEARRRALDGKALDEGWHDQRTAQAIGERFALDFDPMIIERDRPWRTARKRPTDRQLALARQLHVPHPETYTSGGLGQQIDIALVSRRIG